MPGTCYFDSFLQLTEKITCMNKLYSIHTTDNNTWQVGGTPPSLSFSISTQLSRPVDFYSSNAFLICSFSSIPAAMILVQSNKSQLDMAVTLLPILVHTGFPHCIPCIPTERSSPNVNWERNSYAWNLSMALSTDIDQNPWHSLTVLYELTLFSFWMSVFLKDTLLLYPSSLLVCYSKFFGLCFTELMGV